ncbi:MAG: PAS domain S-box protein, partial [Anaerobacillus sp.]
MQIKTGSIPWIIIGCYFLFGSLWILLSDTILYNFSSDFISNKQIGMYKGWFFILLTCGFLYFLLKHLLQRNYETEKRLLESEERYRRLVESSPYAICLMQNGEINYTNQTGLDMIGIENIKDLYNDHLSLVANLEDTNRIKSLLTNMKATRDSRPKTLEYKLLRSNDEVIDVESTFIPITFKEKEAIIIQTNDITERNNAVKELWEAKQMIQAIG